MLIKSYEKNINFPHQQDLIFSGHISLNSCITLYQSRNLFINKYPLLQFNFTPLQLLYRMMQISIKTLALKNQQQFAQKQKQIFLENHQITNKQTLEVYKEALTFSNLLLQHEIHTRNVKIYENDHIHQIYSTSHRVKNNNKLPHLVMLHGFGGTALTFIRTFQHLKQHYQVHALDTFGVGLSSVGNYSQKFTSDQAKHYFIDAVQQWRKALKIQTFTLLGHSFGGYISALYCEKYPGHVKRLILLSPAGTSYKTKQQIQKEIEKRKSTSFSSKLFMWIAQKIYNINIRPSSIMSSCILGNTFIERITSNRLKLKDSQKLAWTKYLKAISNKKKSSQTGFYKLFGWPVIAKKSIQQIIKDQNNNFKFPIEFYYGDTDWMQRNGAIRLHKEKQNVICEIIAQAGHQIIFDNPLGVVEKVLRQERVDKQEISQQEISMGMR